MEPDEQQVAVGDMVVLKSGRHTMPVPPFSIAHMPPVFSGY